METGQCYDRVGSVEMDDVMLMIGPMPLSTSIPDKIK